MSLDIQKINSLLAPHKIKTFSIHINTKASEEYIDVEIKDTDSKFVWKGYIPFKYRRTGVDFATEESVAKHLIEIQKYFKPHLISEWVEREKKYWEAREKANVTKPFFDALSGLGWVDPDDFPDNRNPQRRLQDIKEMGYTIGSKKVGRGYARQLVPIPRAAATGYETFSAKFKEKVIKVLGGVNAYERSSASAKTLIPDHKFPEIRWDEKTRADNPETMSDAEIKNKFQLVDNQRNQQKREVCRAYFQTGKRGTIFGINYYYEGNNNWPVNVPKIGKAAEKGCVGCGWYDIAKWRESLNQKASS